jgi:hypothetical protein
MKARNRIRICVLAGIVVAATALYFVAVDVALAFFGTEATGVVESTHHVERAPQKSFFGRLQSRSYDVVTLWLDDQMFEVTVHGRASEGDAVPFVYLSWAPAIAREGTRHPTPFHFLWKHNTLQVLLGGALLLLALYALAEGALF